MALLKTNIRPRRHDLTLSTENSFIVKRDFNRPIFKDAYWQWK